MNIATLLDMLAGAEPERVALGHYSQGLTYAGLLEKSERMAGLLEAHGRPAVLYATTATDAFPVGLFAAAMTDRPFVPLNYRLAAGPLDDLIQAQAPALLIAERPVLERAAQGHAGLIGLESRELLGQLDSAEPAKDRSENGAGAAVLLHTSGTTGRPKVAILRHTHLSSYVINSSEFLSAGTDEAQLVSVPPYHIAAVAGLLTALYSGRRMVQLPNFSAGEWVRTAREQKITHAMVVPTMLARIVDFLEEKHEHLPDLRHLSYGGGRMPLPVVERALSLLPHVNFVNGYGLTETTSSIAVLGPQDHRDAVTSVDPDVRKRLGSVGRPLPAVEIDVRDAAGEPVPAGTKGELWVRGPQVSGEYEHATITDEQGWFHTNDAGWIDSAGYVFVDGRLDDVIVRGGENLSPGEIEEVLVKHQAVAEAAVVGVRDEQWGEVAVAAVVLKPGHEASEHDLCAWVGENLRSTRVPARVVFRTSLPHSETGKLLRRVLKSEVIEIG